MNVYELPPAHLWLPGMVAMLALIAASGFFSGSETALFYLSHEELRTMRYGSLRDRVAASLMQQPDRLLTAILFWNLVINLSFFATSVVVARRLYESGYPTAAGLFGVTSLVAIILFGEVLPKSGAVVFRRGVASLVSLPLAAAVRVLDLITPALGRFTVIARRTFWPNVTRESLLEPEDLERAIEVSRQSDEVIQQERRILHNVLDLSEITAEEVMRPRGTYVALAAPISLADLRNEVPDSGYILVQPDETDGNDKAIPLEDFSAIPESHLEETAEDVVYVPWCATLADTFQQLRERYVGVAVVVNEHGDSIGIVTYEDIVDTVFSPQPSRARRVLQREPVLEISRGNYHVEGMTTLRYLCGRLGLEFEPSDEGVFTVAGLLHDELEHIPEVGDDCRWRGFRIKVIEADSPRQLRVLMSRMKNAQAVTSRDATASDRG